MELPRVRYFLAVAQGALVIPIARRFAFAQIRGAQQFAQQGAGGKVLVLVSDGGGVP
jgi:hypothetical protein